MSTPTYTFSGDPATSSLDAVRFWIQDMGGPPWLVSDQAINYVLTGYPNVLLAAAQICRSLAALFAQRVSKRVGDLSINFSDKAKQYLALADDLEAQGSMSSIAPYAGGISHADRDAVDGDSDRVKPPFKSKQFDNPSNFNNNSGDPNWTPFP